ncbi:DNA adenine methylase [Kingella kingae]|uniref:site-specific DNA-methyltransferase (adenine-specific) n=2 Tax=Kingella kingae TaxID=504 RepID=F5S658_KINKI|nr:DNA adenine methylase [Kingella kingae]EGK10537.1 adenine-specific DNA methylase [Kingella kingae ATCC 23330]MDK4529289.1 DNA adenine methylase [Kingella kingae]MDK4533507.1 DNA adenine methylase [Kingella kingae]MDK4540011.1 DNA adenine methylase [Kingella kingae]MDK4552540.1 DNA adenine methylase [Kingella kingae]
MPYLLENRRYIGNKTKLTQWIKQLILLHTHSNGTFFDVFAGTGSVANALSSHFQRVLVNDVLHANRVIYQAFWGVGDVDEAKIQHIAKTIQSWQPNDLPNNYFSDNFGGKFFSEPVAKQIGFAREYLGSLNLTSKEHSILLASLIYSADKIANTVGHFDAYIKKEIAPKPLPFDLVNWSIQEKFEIFQQDANQLVRQQSADVVYLDPPYNSRQYSRFYHVYETLVKWDKPTLSGVAMKPPPENMSDYCRSNAPTVFADLVAHIQAKYIVVSYNNTYFSKSNSSRNKIELQQIADTLNCRGQTQTFTQEHRAFNTGKTEFNNHQELLFITKVTD